MRVCDSTRFGKCDISLAQATEIRNIHNCGAFRKHCGVSTVAERLLGSSALAPGPTASGQGRQQQCLEPVVCTHLAAGASCMYLCRHTHRVGGQGRQQGPEPAMGQQM